MCFTSCGWTPTVAEMKECFCARATAARLVSRSHPIVTKCPTPASRARWIIASRSASKRGSSMWQWLSLSMATYWLLGNKFDLVGHIIHIKIRARTKHHKPYCLFIDCYPGIKMPEKISDENRLGHLISLRIYLLNHAIIIGSDPNPTAASC